MVVVVVVMVAAVVMLAAVRKTPSWPNQAKARLMGGMPATSQTLDAYKRSKAEVPKALEEAQALLRQVQTLAATRPGTTSR